MPKLQSTNLPELPLPIQQVLREIEPPIRSSFFRLKQKPGETIDYVISEAEHLVSKWEGEFIVILQVTQESLTFSIEGIKHIRVKLAKEFLPEGFMVFLIRPKQESG
jgi:hypothetical protein